MSERILIIDDEELMRTSLKRELEAEGFSVFIAENGTRAIELAKAEQFDIVICDVRMPDIDGIETIAAIKKVQPVTRNIMITAYASNETPISALKLRVDDYLMKPFSIEDLLRSIKSALMRSKQSSARSGSLTGFQKNFLKIIRGIFFESRISHLIGHSEQVAGISLKIGSRLGFSPEKMQRLYLAALLHDIGYIELPSHMLEKNEFQEQDLKLVQNHPLLARELLSPFGELKDIATIILYHHERWDGSGYPQGLEGEQIPLESRIIAAAETYDSLISERPHRVKKEADDALRLLDQERGKSFDPHIIQILTSIVELYDEEEHVPSPPVPDEAERQINVLLNLAHVYGELGNYEVAEEAYGKVTDLFSAHASDELLMQVEKGRLSILTRAGRLEEALAIARGLLSTAQKKSMEFLRAQVLLQTALIKIKLTTYKEALEDLKLARETFIIWESAYHLCETDFLLSALYSLNDMKDEPGFAQSLASFLSILQSEQAYDILAKYRDLSHIVLRYCIENDLYLQEITQLFIRTRSSPIEIIEPLMDDKELGIKLKVLDILKEMRDTKARVLLLRAQADSNKILSDKASKILDLLSDSTDISPVQIFFFDTFRVMVGTTLLGDEAWTTRKAKSLFAYLASRGIEGEREEKLMDLFWLHEAKKARHALHNCISVIRRIFSPYLGEAAKKLVINKKERYFLNRNITCWIDMEEFVTHFHKGRYLFEEHQWQEGLSELKKAERLYIGNFMEGSYDEWSDDLRLLMRNNFIELLDILGKYFFDRNKFEVSINYREKILAHDNCFEDAYSGLMNCHVKLGNKNEAVRVYHRCEEALKKEMNLTPSPRIMELFLRLIE